MLRITTYNYKKLATNVVGALAIGASLLLMTPKNLNAQTSIINGVSDQTNQPVGNALLEIKQASDTLNSYVGITDENGRLRINNVVTDINDNNNTKGTQVRADGTVAINMQSGNGKRTAYAAVGELNKDAIVYNSIGQKVAKIQSEYNPTTGITKASINPSSWADGVYFLVFKGQEQAGATKFMQLSNNVYENTKISGSQLLKEKRAINKNILGKVNSSEDYIVEITETDSSNVPFRKYREENINIIYDEINQVYFTVHRTDLFDNVDITTTIRTGAKPWDKLDGVTVEIYTNIGDRLVGAGVTDNNGEVFIENAPNGENIYFKIGGKEGYYARTGMSKFMLNNPADSVDAVSFMLPPKSGLVPGTNGETVNYELDDIVELFRYFDVTASKSDGINYFLDGFTTNEVQLFDTLLARNCKLFGVNPNIYKRVNERIEFGLDETHYYLTDTDTTNRFGWNIEIDNDQTDNYVGVMNDDDAASFGGKMTLSLNEEAFNKEFERKFGMHEVNLDNRESCMNNIPTMPTKKDRGYHTLFDEFNIGRWTYGYDSKSMKNYIAEDMQSQP